MAQTTWTVDRLSDSGEGTGVLGDLRYCLTNAVDSDRVVLSIEGPRASLLTVRQATDYGISYGHGGRYGSGIWNGIGRTMVISNSIVLKKMAPAGASITVGR